MATKKDDKDSNERAAEAGAGESAAREAQQTERQAAETARQTVRRAAGNGEQAVQAAGRAAERSMAQASEISRRSSEQIRSLVNASARAYREFGPFSRGDVDTFMQSSARLARGMQEVGWEMMQYSQTSLRMGLQVANELLTCRSMEDVVEIQRGFLKDSVDSFLQESARLLELSSSVATDAIGPLAERVRERSQGETRQ